MQRTDAQVLVFARNSFYKALHYLALAAFFLSLIVIGLLFWVLMFLSQNPTKPLYFVTDKVGRLIEVLPVDKPSLTKEEIMAWVVEAVEATYSYDYVNFRAQLQGAQKYYTSYGWNNYMTALKASGNLVGLQERKWVVQAKVVEPPTLLGTRLIGGAYAWKFRMPLLVTYLTPPYDGSVGTQTNNALEITVIVQRQPEIKSYKGLGIVQIVGSVATTVPTPTQTISDVPT